MVTERAVTEPTRGNGVPDSSDLSDSPGVSDGPSLSDSPELVSVRPLGRTLDRFLHHLGAPDASTLSQLDGKWEQIVGPGLAQNTQPSDIVDGILRVVCSDGAWASQVRWQEQQILRRFAEVFPETELRSIAARVRLS